MLILNSILCLKSIYFFYHFTDCQRIWNISSPGNHSTCRDFRRNSSLYKNILSPIFCSTFDGYRIPQSICCHNSGIGYSFQTYNFFPSSYAFFITSTWLAAVFASLIPPPPIMPFKEAFSKQSTQPCRPL